VRLSHSAWHSLPKRTGATKLFDWNPETYDSQRIQFAYITLTPERNTTEITLYVAIGELFPTYA